MRMILSDASIKDLIDNRVLIGASKDNVGPISCDLTVRNIYFEGEKYRSLKIPSGDSVFIETNESINLTGKNLAAEVRLRNRWLRRGLSLDAPMYFPGHNSRFFFRVNNLCTQEISLCASDAPAQVIFYKVEDNIECRYRGAFNNETEYDEKKDLADVGHYDAFESRASLLDGKIKKYEQRIDEINKSIYGNVLTLLGIFIAVASISNVVTNSSAASPRDTAVLCLVITGSFALLFGFIARILKDEKGASTAWAIGAICFTGVLIASFFLYPWE